VHVVEELRFDLGSGALLPPEGADGSPEPREFGSAGPRERHVEDLRRSSPSEH
jgi:hypothetical protein